MKCIGCGVTIKGSKKKYCNPICCRITTTSKKNRSISRGKNKSYLDRVFIKGGI